MAKKTIKKSKNEETYEFFELIDAIDEKGKKVKVKSLVSTDSEEILIDRKVYYERMISVINEQLLLIKSIK